MSLSDEIFLNWKIPVSNSPGTWEHISPRSAVGSFCKILSRRLLERKAYWSKVCKELSFDRAHANLRDTVVFSKCKSSKRDSLELGKALICRLSISTSESLAAQLDPSRIIACLPTVSNLNFSSSVVLCYSAAQIGLLTQSSTLVCLAIGTSWRERAKRRWLFLSPPQCPEGPHRRQ